MLLKNGVTLGSNNKLHYVLLRSGDKTDLLMLLLRYGADPFDYRLKRKGIGIASEVLALAKEKEKRLRRMSAGPKKEENICVVVTGKPLEQKGQSRWSSLFSKVFRQRRS